MSTILTDEKIIEILCIVDGFCKEFAEEFKKLQILPDDGKKRRNRSCEMSGSEIMTVLMLFHFGTFRNFKHYYLHYIGIYRRKDFPGQLSYSRFIAVQQRVFMPVMFFLNTVCSGKCTGITFMDSASVKVCHNKRISRNRVFDGTAKTGKNSQGRFHGFKLHLVCNDKGELLSFCLTPGNVDDRDPQTVYALTGGEIVRKIFR
jgi:hypothetical protein